MADRKSKPREPAVVLTPEQEVKDDMRTYKALSAVADSKGGQILLDALYRDIADAVFEIVGGYRTLPEIELRALGAKLEARINMTQVLNRADANFELAAETLKELTT